MLKIGISACFFHEDPKRAIFKGMTLQYIEQNVAHWLMQRDVLAFMVPVAGRPHPARRQQGDGGRVRGGARRPRADGRLRRLPGIVRRKGAAPRMERRPHPRRLRDRAVARVHGGEKAGAGRLPRGAGDQRGDGRHALPGHRHAAAARAQPSRLDDLRRQLPRDVVRSRQPARAPLSADARSSRPTRFTTRRSRISAATSSSRPIPSRIASSRRCAGRARATFSRSSGTRSSTRRTTASFIDDTPILDDFLAYAARHKAAAFAI